MSTPDAQRWALTYAGLGWRVLPVVAGDKRPMYRGWQADATTDTSLIERHWRREPAPNIGMVTGESFVAFDIEAPHLDRLRQWMVGRRHRLTETAIARTGRGGIHILARVPSICGGGDLFLDGIHIGELKAQGGFIVAAPSVTSGRYGWHRSPLEVEVAAAPDWLMGLVRVSSPAIAAGCRRTIGIAEGERRLAALARTVADAPEGRRNDILYWATRRAIDRGIPDAVACSVLSRMAATAGLPEREIGATIDSARKAALR